MAFSGIYFIGFFVIQSITNDYYSYQLFHFFALYEAINSIMGKHPNHIIWLSFLQTNERMLSFTIYEIIKNENDYQ